MAFTWFLALLLSFGLRFWGLQHPDPFQVRPFLVLLLLFGPSILMGAWVGWFGFLKAPLAEGK